MSISNLNSFEILLKLILKVPRVTGKIVQLVRALAEHSDQIPALGNKPGIPQILICPVSGDPGSSSDLHMCLQMHIHTPHPHTYAHILTHKETFLIIETACTKLSKN